MTKRSSAIIFATFVSLAVMATPASALEPWWHLMSAASPSYIKSGLATDEVVSVTSTTAEGNFTLTDTATEKVESFKWDGTHEAVLTGLENLFGAGNVQVTGGPAAIGSGNTTAGSTEVTGVSTSLGAFAVGEEISGAPAIQTGSKIESVEPGKLTLSIAAVETQVGAELAVRAPYVVTFTGELGDQDYDFTGRDMTGENARLTELTRGRPDATIAINAVDVGNAGVSGETTMVDRLPAGLRAISIVGFDRLDDASTNLSMFPCELKTLTCTLTESLNSAEQVEILIGVVVEGARSSSESHEYNEVTFTGGGAPVAHVTQPVTVSAAAIPYGLQDFGSSLEDEGGAPDTQAGSHPYQFTTSLDFNQVPANFDPFPAAEPVQLPKSFAFRLPPGLIGNPTPFPKCTLAEFLTVILNEHNLCEASTAVGFATTTFDEPEVIGLKREEEPLFSIEPAVGEPARFGFILDQTPVFIDASVRSGEDYGVTAHVENISQVVGTLNSVVTFWGVPGESSHDSARGSFCLLKQECPGTSETSPPALFTLPTSCSGELQFPAEGDSWAQFNERQAEHLPEQLEPLGTSTSPALDGCNRLPFTPSVRVTPDGTAASSSTGLNVDVHVPQESIVSAHGLAQSAVRDISVTLPEGVQINPSGADGLQSCSESLVGYTGSEVPPLQPGTRVQTFKPYIPGDTFATDQVGEGRLPEGEATLNPGVNFCSNASKIGEVTIKSPLLPPTQPLKGFVYLADQNQNPFGSLVALYLVAEDPTSGTVFKSVGETTLSPTGQITGTFQTNPQLAFEDAELHFFGGERAPLATPSRCGSYTTTASFTPWSGNEAVNSSSTFDITSGPHGSSCTYPGQALPFSPSLQAGSPNVNAGAFSPLVTTISREDGQQSIHQVTLHMAPGMSGILAGVPLCGEAQANEGTCGAASQIGETTVSAGVGSDPVSVTGGRVYLTEKYAGAPFGLSIVNPVKAGPFDLEHDTSNPANQPPCDCVVVRAKIEIDPTTAALTITTDAAGPHAIPQIIDGVPVQIKAVNVVVNGVGGNDKFTFNPTNCNKMEITGAIAAWEGASSPVSVPFQATNCKNLAFTPKFTASTSAKDTFNNTGASLTTRVVEPKTAQGTQADIAKVKVELPVALPSRLTTLQKACVAKVFEANPANCPSASFIGHAVVHTQLVPVPLEGPAIFVSHGGEAFPSLIIVLQGYGVKIDLVGTTFISKKGITSTTFKTVPDQPFETFELTLPTGKFSALAALTNVCKPVKTETVKKKVSVKRNGKTVKVTKKVSEKVAAPLLMPTEFVAQNGAEFKQTTKISVIGCPTRKASKPAKKKGKRKGQRK